MYSFLIILVVLAALLMVGIVLIQESKGGGLSSELDGYKKLLGAAKTTSFVEKATWILAIAIVVISVLCTYAIT